LTNHVLHENFGEASVKAIEAEHRMKTDFKVYKLHLSIFSILYMHLLADKGAVLQFAGDGLPQRNPSLYPRRQLLALASRQQGIGFRSHKVAMILTLSAFSLCYPPLPSKELEF
jgi:hypothetical protein